MDREFLQEIIAEMVKYEKAAWLNPLKKSSVLILWRRPAEWAELVYKFVERIGGIGSIFTVYDLIEGDDSIKEGKRWFNIDKNLRYDHILFFFFLFIEFHGLPENLMKLVIGEMEKSGKARLFSDDNSNSTSFKERGVKFF